MEQGKKDDQGKSDWHALPLCLVEPMVQVAEAGGRKYGRFNILRQFERPEERFFSASLRHAMEAQIDQLAIDPEDGCYHLAKVAFNALAELYHAKRGVAKSCINHEEFAEDAASAFSAAHDAIKTTKLSSSNKIEL